ncbi:MAG: NifU family protein [Candidatus Eremiobacteraeota bacterium]|nr:NifU family protein [Candidatus Eremiobacteraeota bacterium]MBC5827388.1 NifU family protein [Candidatus Eremiobacteraeota bacterium]
MPTGTAAPAPDLRALGNRVEGLLQDLGGAPSPEQTRAKAEELVSLMAQLYGAGLERILGIVYDEGGEPAQRIFDRLCDDDFVASLLVLHGLHPLTVEGRIQRALDKVRTYLHSHEGDVALLRVEGEIAYLRMAGSCNGCPSSSETMKLAIEKAIFEAAPEITDIRAEGVREKASAQKKASDWVSLSEVPELTERGIAAIEVEGTPVLLLQSGNTLLAYRNQCPSCFTSLADGRLEWPQLHCPTCRQGYDVVKAGRAYDKDGLWIEPFPLVTSQGRVQLALPVMA